MDFKGLKKDELETLLSKLSLYKDLQKKIWKRGVDLFKRERTKEKLLQVEYFPSISEKIAYDNAIHVYSKIFNINPKQDEIRFIEKRSLGGWIKVYKDDSMVDLSFSKVENLLK